MPAWFCGRTADVTRISLFPVGDIANLTASSEANALSFSRIDMTHFVIVAATPAGGVTGVLYTLSLHLNSHVVGHNS